MNSTAISILALVLSFGLTYLGFQFFKGRIHYSKPTWIVQTIALLIILGLFYSEGKLFSGYAMIIVGIYLSQIAVSLKNPKE